MWHLQDRVVEEIPAEGTDSEAPSRSANSCRSCAEGGASWQRCIACLRLPASTSEMPAVLASTRCLFTGACIVCITSCLRLISAVVSCSLGQMSLG